MVTDFDYYTRDLPSLMACFDKLEFIMRRFLVSEHISSSLLPPFTSMHWLSKLLPSDLNQSVCPRLVQSAMQCVMAAFVESQDWQITVCFPGLPSYYHPASGYLNFDGTATETTVSAEWALLVLTPDGFRPSPIDIRTREPGNDPFLWRSCMQSRAMLMHSPWIADDQLSSFGQEMTVAENALAEGNCGPLRMRRYRVDKGRYADICAEAMYGAAWSLASIICRHPKTSVAAGMWKLPDAASQEIKARGAVMQHITLLLFIPALYNPSTAEMDIGEWMLLSNTDDVMIGRCVQTLHIAHSNWLNAYVEEVGALLCDENIIPCDVIDTILQLFQSKKLDHTASDVDIDATCDFLIRRGQMDWAIRLRRHNNAMIQSSTAISPNVYPQQLPTSLVQSPRTPIIWVQRLSDYLHGIRVIVKPKHL